jgi:integrase
MTSAESSRRRRRGSILWLPSGSARVKVDAGVDPVTGEDVWLRETVRKGRGTKRETEREADKVLTTPLNQVEERRNPRTTATVNQLLDRWIDVIGSSARPGSTTSARSKSTFGRRSA